MNIKVHFRDGVTGGALTTDHPASSYGQPVFVPDYQTSFYLPSSAYGAADLPAGTVPFVLEEPITGAQLRSIENAGFKVEGIQFA